jgi:hypothetical protein
MKKTRIFSIVISIGVFLPVVGSAYAQDKDKTTEKSGFLDVDSSRFPAAITAELVNGTIEYLGNKSRARIALKWSLLPLDDTLKKQAETDNIEPIICQIRNEDLGESGAWFDKLDDGCKEKFKKAKIVDAQGKLQKQLPDKCAVNEENSFQRLWLCKDGGGYELVKTSIPSSQYFGLLRDNLQLNGLLNSQGIDYSINVNSTLANGEEEKFTVSEKKKIVWKILVYEFPATKSGVNYYRFVTTASIFPNDIYLPIGVRTATLNANVKLKKSKTTIGISERNLGGLIDSPLPVVPPKPSTLNPIPESATTDLTRTLSLFGSPNLGEVVTNNFLGGTKDASLVYGGMIGKNTLEPIVGANLGLADLGDGKLGALIGVGTNSNNTPFYIGPSIQYSILTISGGVRFATNGNSVDTNLAGIFSLDLSQLLGGKREITEFQVANTSTGGNWGRASDDIYKNLALIDYQLTNSTGTSIPEGISVTQTKTCDGTEISPGMNLSLRKDSGFQFIPRGKYKYNEIQNYDLKVDGIKPISQAKPFDACIAEGALEMKLTIKKNK